MKRGLREPFFITRVINLILGVIILALMLVVIIKKNDTEIFKIIIFALAAIENFIGATISFSEKKRVKPTTTEIKPIGFIIQP